MVPAKSAAPATFEYEGLVLVVSEGEPLVSDDALATFLQAPANDVRGLIKRNVDEGHIAATSNRRTAPRFTRDGKSRGSVTVHGYLLTEADALFVVTRSNTPRAVAATKTMIAAFTAARRQLATSPAPPALPPPVKALPPAPPPAPLHSERRVMMLMLGHRIGDLIVAEDYLGAEVVADTVMGLVRAFSTKASASAPLPPAEPPDAAVAGLAARLQGLVREGDWRGVELAGEMIALLARPYAGTKRPA